MRSAANPSGDRRGRSTSPPGQPAWHGRPHGDPRGVGVLPAGTSTVLTRPTWRLAGVLFGPCWTRTSDLGIKSPREQAVASCKRRKDAAKRTVRGCSELQRAVGRGDESVLSLVLPLLLKSTTRRPQSRRYGGVALDRTGHENPVPRVVGPVRRTRPVETRDVEFLRSITDRRIKITVPGPFTMTQQAQNYADERSLALAYAEAAASATRTSSTTGRAATPSCASSPTARRPTSRSRRRSRTSTRRSCATSPARRSCSASSI
jgi:hypothetical protein